MPDVDVLADGFELAFAADAGVERLVVNGSSELSVCDKIRISANRRCEMGVDFRCEAVMAEFGVGLGAGAEILGGHHAARCHDADEGVEEWLVGIDAAVEGVC